MHKVLYTLAFAVIIAVVGMHGDVYAQYICGDANGDGDLNVGDAVYLINFVFKGGPAPDPVCVGDANGDTDTNVGDAVYLINYVFKSGPAPEEGCCQSYCPPTVTDIDGNVYQTVKIGEQCWMMENLKVTHYRNGDPIPHVTDGSTWGGLYTGAYCEYDNNSVHVTTYGRLYNWYAVADGRNIAPEGWHVPTDEEWKQLEMYLGMSQAEADATGWRGTDEGSKLKETGTTHWSYDTGATNESGFTALPGGYRYIDGTFLSMSDIADFWSSTDSSSDSAWYRYLDRGRSQVHRDGRHKQFGFSVRCVRD